MQFLTHVTRELVTLCGVVDASCSAENLLEWLFSRKSKGENIVKWIKRQRISNLERMEEDRIPKKIFTQELEGTRQRGRPRKGWKQEAGRDLQVLGVRRRRELVTDRKK